jgi:hypothetical protein
MQAYDSVCEDALLGTLPLFPAGTTRDKEKTGWILSCRETKTARKMSKGTPHETRTGQHQRVQPSALTVGPLWSAWVQ